MPPLPVLSQRAAIPSDGPPAAFVADLEGRFSGDIRFDRLYRALYATDASIYHITPDVVLCPRSIADVQSAVTACGRHRVPITARGAGTGLAGGAVNRGVILDCSRYLHRILHIDPAARIAVVEPGVVLDELNAALRPHGLHFAPDVAPSSRATIGGMIANNSCGAHSVIYGRTCDHVASLDVVLADGTQARWGANSEWRMVNSEGRERASGPSLFASRHSSFAAIEETLAKVKCDLELEIAARFPRVMRRNGGYALDRLSTADGRINVEQVIIGSEGTLAIVVGATLRLVPLPRHRGLVVAHFEDLLDALAATPVILEHQPAAIELIDHLIIAAARAHPAIGGGPLPIEGEPRGILIIELFDDDPMSLQRRLTAVSAELATRQLGYAAPIILDAPTQAAVWNVRRSGLGLLMSRPGDRQPYDFVEDTAVPPARLRDYIARFQAILAEEGVTDASYYAHASVGCLHVKPVLNLRDRDDVGRMLRIADRISTLALEFGGTMTGEHGDGILRSTWLEKMYGPRIMHAFRQIKHAFDPLGILNPGKIVDPLPMAANLRHAERIQDEPSETMLDFSAHAGMAGLANMCSGVGQCRQKLVGTMCPSYMATLDEQHTTRARANALRVALSDRGLIAGLADPALDDVMDLCLSCKACKTECPTGVDMARLKSEWQWQKSKGAGASLRSRLIARTHRLLALASHAPGLANAVSRADLTQFILERWLGISRAMPLPALANQTFRDGFRRRRGPGARLNRKPGAAGPVALFVDTWTNYFTPDVGRAAVAILESLGHRVIVPETVCCGRPAISKGALDVARELAGQNIEILAGFAEQQIPIVGVEPSCILTFVDEFPQLARDPRAKRIAAGCQTIESFLATRLDDLRDLAGGHASFLSIPQSLHPAIHRSPDLSMTVLYHAHCHQKALVGSADALHVLSAVSPNASEINSGCCGMAGSFGHEREHYSVARAIGEQRLFPAIRAAPTAQIVVSGFSCRCQIAHHTGARPLHVVEWIAAALGATVRS